MEKYNLVNVKLDFRETGSDIVTKLTLTWGNVYMMEAMKQKPPFLGELGTFCMH
jgi:hypothetical protein